MILPDFETILTLVPEFVTNQGKYHVNADQFNDSIGDFFLIFYEEILWFIINPETISLMLPWTWKVLL